MSGTTELNELVPTPAPSVSMMVASIGGGLVTWCAILCCYFMGMLG